METKSGTKIAIIEKTPPIFTTEGNQGFRGAFPPTNEDVILQYFGYHNYLQGTTNRQSSVQDAVKLVVSDITHFWDKTGIKLKNVINIRGMVFKLVNYFGLRKIKI